MWKTNKRFAFGFQIALAIASFAQADEFNDLASSNWPQWRGPQSNGVAINADPPLTWSESENLTWKTRIDGLGHGTPIVWEDRIFLQTAIPIEKDLAVPDVIPPGTPNVELSPGESLSTWKPQQFAVLCIDRRTGSELWRRIVHEAMPHQGHHLKGSFASQSALTDGTHVFACFGSFGLYCLDFDGNITWQHSPQAQVMEAGLGEGGSPALFGDTLVVVVDHELQSFVVAFDKSTGKEKWRQNRNEVSNWSTPRIFTHDGIDQVVVNGETVRCYTLASGELLWECAGQSLSAVPMPAIGHGLAFATTGWRRDTLHAIRLGRRGDLTDSDSIAWKLNRGTPYVPSPMLWGNEIYLLEDKNFFSCLRAKDGKQHYLKSRIPRLLHFSASPVGAKDRIYLLSEEGVTVVVQRGPQFKVLAMNELHEKFMASPAIIGDSVILRGNRHLYCFSRPKPPPAH